MEMGAERDSSIKVRVPHAFAISERGERVFLKSFSGKLPHYLDNRRKGLLGMRYMFRGKAGDRSHHQYLASVGNPDHGVEVNG